MLRKHYESTKIDGRSWLQVLSWTHWSISSGIHQVVERLLLRCIHHFESDLINNMDHMRISDTEQWTLISDP